MKTIYEGEISEYSFMMVDKNTIEIWNDDNDNPEAFIYLKESEVLDEKDFHVAISDWWMKNIG